MSIFKFLETVGNGVATSIALKQAQAGSANPTAGGGRKLKRKRDGGEECTPCAAMGEVDAVRKSYGFSTK